jgi:hypothetical protein
MEAVILGASIGVGAYSAIREQELNDQALQFKQEQIRSQQVQLRLQDVQQSIAEQTKLRQTIATTMVMAGSRGISPASSSIRAIFEHDYSQYDEDKDARRLNLSEKELGLNFEDENARLSNEATTTNIWTNFGKSVANSAMLYEGSQFPTGKIAAASGSQIPDVNA